MHRVGSRIARALGVLALAGTALFAATSAVASGAPGQGAANCSAGWTLCTTVMFSGSVSPTPLDPNGAGGGGSSGGGYISSCWLQPQTAWGDENTDASSPAGFQQYLQDLAKSQDNYVGFNQQVFQPIWNLYWKGSNIYGPADPGVGLLKGPNPNFTGTPPGKWYGIACVPSSTNQEDAAGIQAAMGVSAAQVGAERWFWLQDGQKPPTGVQVMTPDLLARYAANRVLITPGFPALSPAVNAVQTVNLPVSAVNGVHQNGYYTYSTSAQVAGLAPSTVYAYPVTVTYTASPGSLITPASVTCSFNRDGSIKGSCPTFQFTAPAAANSGDEIIATSIWDVRWYGSEEPYEPGWYEQLPGPVSVVPAPVAVQEIEAINSPDPTVP